MNSAARVVRNYVFWSYERGSIHFDIMVTLILLFMFVGPHYINFHDKPVPTVPLHEAAIVVKPAGREGRFQRFQYEIRADDLGTPRSEEELRDAVRNAIEPISGAVTLDGPIERVQDASHRVVAYNVMALR